MTEAATDGRAAAVDAAVRENDYLPALTGLRGVAAGWVLLYHAWQFSGGPRLAVRIAHHTLDFTALAACGFLGVDLFFVLSGFLLSIPFHRHALGLAQRPRLSTFWERRCRRVLPAYWLQLVILAVVYIAVGRAAQVTVPIVAAHVVLAQNIVPWPVPLLNPVYWSMPIEWDFYIVLPLLAALLARLRVRYVLFAMIVLAVAFRLACYQAAFDPGWARYLDYGNIMQLPARLDEFFFGVLGAWAYLRVPLSVRAARAGILAGASGLGIAMFAFTRLGDYIVAPRLPWLLLHFSWVGAALGVIVWAAASQPSGRSNIFCGRALAWLGLVSYSLYLWHFPVLQTVDFLGWTHLARVPAWIVVGFGAVPLALLLAWLSYRFVEKPFLAGHQRKISELQQQTAAAH